MDDPLTNSVERASSEAEPAPVTDAAGSGEPSPPEQPGAYPFWGYSTVLLFVSLALPSMLLGVGIVRGFLRLFGIHTTVPVAELIPGQFIGYGILFGLLAVTLRVQYDKPFWSSLGWLPSRVPLLWLAIAGFAAVFVVGLTSALLRTPNTPNPMTEMMRGPSAMILMAIFGTTVGPLCEELAFRGLLQPLLVRTFGVAGGILMAALPFGLLHFREYGNSWRHVVLISLAGAAFGWMRQISGSTKGSTIMHAAYNALLFFAAIGKDLSPK
jgi:uncharacterized protein